MKILILERKEWVKPSVPPSVMLTGKWGDAKLQKLDLITVAELSSNPNQVKAWR